MKRVIIVGSPRSNGRSAHVAEMLFEANIDERPEDELFLVPVSEIEVGPCIGCGACRKLTEVVLTDETGEERVEMRPRCVFDDDMQTLYDLLDDADEVTVVSPVYFSGPPSMMKCVLERMQPYFYADTRKAPKRPVTLHVIGEGGDPHGFDALVSEVRSALSCAGFRLERVLDWVGKVDEGGEIMAEAKAYGVKPPGTFGSILKDLSKEAVDDGFEEEMPIGQATASGTSDEAGAKQTPTRSSADASRKGSKNAEGSAKGSRPKLNLTAGSQRAQSKGQKGGKSSDRNMRGSAPAGRRPTGKPKGNASGAASGNRRGKGGAGGGKRSAGKAGNRG